MNMAEFAKEMGISKATLYRKISDAGIDLSEIRGDDGQLTDTGLTTLAAVLETSQRRLTPQPCDVSETEDTDRLNRETVDDLRRQLRETRDELAAAKEQISTMLREAADRERENAEAWRRYAERQQQIEAQRMLTEGGGENVETVGLFARWRAKLTGK